MTTPSEKRPGTLGIFLGLGATLTVWMTAGMLAGIWMDSKWEIRPWGILAGSLAGISGCVYTVIRIVKKLE